MLAISDHQFRISHKILRSKKHIAHLESGFERAAQESCKSNKRGVLNLKPKLSTITTDGKSLLLAYDQGLEHGPTDFDDKNVDPDYIQEIAVKGKYNGLIFQKGVAEKYYNCKIPLILKLNGKTNLVKGEPIAAQLCSVKEAIELGAKAVGYTIYVGSAHEATMFKDFQ
ncbi:hypothetical protein FJZ53_06885, partial [Candidatus Woesearchaeota archaeon]|nr:hypothetical protein [Candidatus Woesearchaeota archaeon]